MFAAGLAQIDTSPPISGYDGDGLSRDNTLCLSPRFALLARSQEMRLCLVACTPVGRRQGGLPILQINLTR